jgi:adenine phosphoribosyltransferase
MEKRILEELLVDVKDFPKKGIIFKDISKILSNPTASRFVVNDIIENIKDDNIDMVIGLDARGFILGSRISDGLDVGFCMVRKKGKMPPPYVEIEYELEYGSDIITLSSEIIKPGMNIHIHDDILATGGTAETACKLVEKLNANVVSLSFILELQCLNTKLSNNYKKYSVIKF